MRPRPLLTTLLLLAAAHTPLAAQELSPEALQAIHNASRARVRLAGEGWHPLNATAADSAGAANGGLLYLGNGRAGQPPGAVPLSQIAQVQVKAGSHAGSGAKIGGAIGLGLSLLAVAVTAGDDWAAPTGGQAIAGTFVTTAFGAGIGALVGLTAPRWRTVYGVDPP
jgi:hypothetical protein